MFAQLVRHFAHAQQVFNPEEAPPSSHLHQHRGRKWRIAIAHVSISSRLFYPECHHCLVFSDKVLSVSIASYFRTKPRRVCAGLAADVALWHVLLRSLVSSCAPLKLKCMVIVDGDNHVSNGGRHQRGYPSNTQMMMPAELDERAHHRPECSHVGKDAHHHQGAHRRGYLEYVHPRQRPARVSSSPLRPLHGGRFQGELYLTCYF